MSYDNPHICAICHLQGTGCCLCIPGLEDKMFGLTIGEIGAICSHTGLDTDAFTVKDIAGKEFLDNLARINPVFLNTLPHGHRSRLLIKNNKCIFLGHEGCTLPDPVRPLFCRLYPFWFTMDGRLMVLSSDRCLAQTNALSINHVISRLETGKEKIERLFYKFTDLAKSHYEQFMKNMIEVNP